MKFTVIAKGKPTGNLYCNGIYTKATHTTRFI